MPPPRSVGVHDRGEELPDEGRRDRHRRAQGGRARLRRGPIAGGVPDFGTPEESVTPAKRRRIVGAARQYLSKVPPSSWREARFDVIAIEGSGDAAVLRRTIKQRSTRRGRFSDIPRGAGLWVAGEGTPP